MAEDHFLSFQIRLFPLQWVLKWCSQAVLGVQSSAQTISRQTCARPVRARYRLMGGLQINRWGGINVIVSEPKMGQWLSQYPVRANDCHWTQNSQWLSIDQERVNYYHCTQKVTIIFTATRMSHWLSLHPEWANDCHCTAPRTGQWLLLHQELIFNAPRTSQWLSLEPYAGVQKFSICSIHRILDNNGLVRQFGYQTTSDLGYSVRQIRFFIRQYRNELSNRLNMCLIAW